MIFQRFLLCTLLIWSCDTGKLNVLASLPNHLKEISATETIPHSELIWVIEDSGNDNHVYGLDTKGNIKADIAIKNSDNMDWEDMTSDNDGNLYIGDFGNNSKKRDDFTIYKISRPEMYASETDAEIIRFKLPKRMPSKNFEAFFLYQDSFYLFSKETKNCTLLKIPNIPGNHTAELIMEFDLKGNHNLVTSADISDDGKTVILLNHDKVWKLTDYKLDHFFSGKIEPVKFNYSSQMEGVCFASSDKVYITDEDNGPLGSNLYELILD